MAHIPGTDRAERRRFVRHFLEMVASMFAGMAVLGGLVSLFCRDRPSGPVGTRRSKRTDHGYDDDRRYDRVDALPRSRLGAITTCIPAMNTIMTKHAAS